MKTFIYLLAISFALQGCKRMFLKNTTLIQNDIFKDERIIERSIDEIIPNNKFNIIKQGVSNEETLFITINNTNRLDENQIVSISKRIADVVEKETLDIYRIKSIEYNYIYEVTENDIIKKQDIIFNFPLYEK